MNMVVMERHSRVWGKKCLVLISHAKQQIEPLAKARGEVVNCSLFNSGRIDGQAKREYHQCMHLDSPMMGM